MGFNLSDYQPVEERNAQFWAKHPTGRILTELVFDDGHRFTFRCEVYRDGDDARPAATGYATETVSNSGVNKTSALENAETSAEGRALARAGFAPKGARPSREEMSKTEQAQPAIDPKTINTPKMARAYLANTCGESGWNLDVVANRFKATTGTELGAATDVAEILKFRDELFAVPSHELGAPEPATNGAAR